MTDEQFQALGERLDKLDNGLVHVTEGISGLHTAVADARHDIGGLGEKLVRIQEALYYIAHKTLPPSQSEELRSMLPDPPKRLSSFSR